jgi:hypothetical protein
MLGVSTSSSTTRRIGSPTRNFKFATLDGLRSFVTRCQPEDATLVGFDHPVRAWARGSEYVQLTEEQYGKLAGRRLSEAKNWRN